MTESHDDLRLALAAYALGTLEPADQHAVEAHLAHCPACVAELDELLAVVPALASLSGDGLAAPVPPTDLFDRIASAVENPTVSPSVSSLESRSRLRSRPRSRRWFVAVAASVVLLAGAGTAIGLAVSSSGPAATTQVSATAGPIHLAVAATDAASGTRLVLTVAGLPTHEHCHLVATAADGSHHDAGSWDATYDGQARVIETTDVARSQLRHLTLFGDDGRRLVAVNL